MNIKQITSQVVNNEIYIFGLAGDNNLYIWLVDLAQWELYQR